MIIPKLLALEKQASNSNFLLRLQIRRPLNLWTFKVAVAEKVGTNKIKILGEMKGWAYHNVSGLQLDTMRVSSDAPAGVGHLIWSATMAWALEETPCKNARLLAIFDEEKQHSRLTRYFRSRKFHVVREVSSSLTDLPLRMVWGGAGSLMRANCEEILEYNYRMWVEKSSIDLSR